MKKMIEYFIKYPVLGNTLVVLILSFGFFTLMGLKTTFFPPEPTRSITLSASYPGASPQEIEEGITTKIEDNLKGITGIERVSSTSRENAVSISVELKHGYDANVLLQEVKNAVDKVNSFPVGMEKINVYKNEAREFVISFALAGNTSLSNLKNYARRIERDLLAKDGISKLTLSGFPNQEIEISFREVDLRKYGLKFDEVASAIGAANLKITGGKIRGTREDFLIRADNKDYYAKDLQNQVVKTTDTGTLIRLKDVADVKDKWAEDPNKIYFNGKPAIVINLQKTNDEDLLEIVKTAKEYMAEFNSKNPDIQLNVLRDGSKTINERISILTTNGAIGVFLVILFLGLSLNPRLAFWVALSIPISFAGMFMFSSIHGLTINVMSLMAMILVIGILVDDGIVIAENIYQHYELGESPLKAAVNGTMEVLPSVISAVLTTVVIFFTFFFLEGGMGDHTADIAYVVSSTLLISLVEAIFILPAHIAHSKALHTTSSNKSNILKKVENVIFMVRDKFYAPLLKKVIKHPVITLAVPVALLLITLGAIKGSIIKTTFFPVLEFDNIQVSLEMPAGTSDRITDKLISDMYVKVARMDSVYRAENPDSKGLIDKIYGRVGPGTHVGSLSIALVSGEERTVNNLQLRQMIRKAIGKIDGVEKLQVGGGGRWGMPVSISLQSDNLEQLQNAKDKLKDELGRFDQLKDVVDNNPRGIKEISVNLKDKAYALGLTTAQVMNQIRSGFFGREAQRILRGIDEVRIWVRYDESGRMTVQQLEDMRIRLADGREFPVSELADISIQRGIMSIYHIDGQRVISVEADIANNDVSVPDVLSKIKTVIMPKITAEFPDVRFNFDGESRENDKTMAAMMKVVPPMLMLMFLIIVVTFRSFSQAGIVFSLIPFALIGVAWGHFVQGYIVSILSLFGTIALIGIVVNDSLVFTDAFNRLIKSGLSFDNALFEAGKSRFRAVVLTSLTTMAGLGPLIFEKSMQAQFLSPMAISIAYGIFFGTMLTLLILPSFLSLNNKVLVFVRSLFSGKKLTKEEVEPAIREELILSAMDPEN
jgi:multidrug efflux pump subunit AcrB